MPFCERCGQRIESGEEVTVEDAVWCHDCTEEAVCSHGCKLNNCPWCNIKLPRTRPPKNRPPKGRLRTGSSNQEISLYSYYKECINNKREYYTVDMFQAIVSHELDQRLANAVEFAQEVGEDFLTDFFVENIIPVIAADFSDEKTYREYTTAQFACLGLLQTLHTLHQRKEA